MSTCHLHILWHNWCFIFLQSSHWSSTAGLFGLIPVLMTITFEYAYEIFLSVFTDFMRLVLGFWKRFFDPFICIIIPSHTLSTFCQTSYLCFRFLCLTTNFPSLLKYACLSQNFITSPCLQLPPNSVVKKKNSHALYFIWKCYANFGYPPKGWEKRWLEGIIGKLPLPSHL